MKNFIYLDKIELKNISFCYDGKKQILNNINLDIDKGDLKGIIGSIRRWENHTYKYNCWSYWLKFWQNIFR